MKFRDHQNLSTRFFIHSVLVAVLWGWGVGHATEDCGNQQSFSLVGGGQRREDKYWGRG